MDRENHLHAELRVARIVPAGDASFVLTDVVVPAEAGFSRTQADGREIYCFGAVHTHDESGTLHIEAVPGNDLSLGAFFASWKGQGTLEESRVFVNGVEISDPERYQLRDGDRVEVLFLPTAP